MHRCCSYCFWENCAFEKMVLVPWGYAIFSAQYPPLALLLKGIGFDLFSLLIFNYFSLYLHFL